MFHAILNRESGTESPSLLRKAQSSRFFLTLDLCKQPTLSCSYFRSPITSIDIERIDGRYLLAGSTEGKVCVYDLEQNRTLRLEPIAKKKEATHLISSCKWYQNDTGAFVTGGNEGKVNVFDTNEMQVVYTFDMSKKVFAVEPGNSLETFHLVACATAGQHVRLCDLRSGGNSHILMGHSSGVISLKWSPRDPHVLVTGSSDHRILLWDIRRSNFMLSFDQYKTEVPHSVKAKVGEELSESEEEEVEEEKVFFIGEKSSKSKRASKTFYGGRQYNPLQGGLSNDDGNRGGSNTYNRNKSKEISAHDGDVNGLCFSTDGLFLFSTGTDQTVRMWNTDNGKNRVFNVTGISNAAGTSNLGMDVSFEGDLLFHPNHNSISAYRIEKASEAFVLNAHFERVNKVVCHPFKEELYSCSNDQTICRWTPSSLKGPLLSTADLQVLIRRNEADQGNLLEVEREDEWSED